MIRIADIFDILTITVLLYFALLWLRNKASRPLVIGIGSIALLYACSLRFDMFLTSSLFKAGITAALVALVVLFQTDIRRAIERLASWSAFRTKHGYVASNPTIDTVVETVKKLADNRIGALIVAKGTESLDRHIRGGVTLSGRVSFPLLYGLFNTESPTHDGAVILEGELIERFAVYLPLSQRLKEGTKAGTRHAAGLGLSEGCDALVIVVSEERGTISICEHGVLDVLSSASALKERLEKFYARIVPKTEKNIRFSWLRKNFGIKIVSLALALGLWLGIVFKADTINRTFTVPIEWRNLSSGYSVDYVKPLEARVAMAGSDRSFNFDAKSLVISLDFSTVQDGTQEVTLTRNNIVNLPSGIRVTSLEPQSVKLRINRLVETELPVKIRTQGRIDPRLAILSMSVEPEKVKVVVPRSRRDDIVSIPTELLDLVNIGQSGTVRLRVLPPEPAALPDNMPVWVKVRFVVGKAQRAE